MSEYCRTCGTHISEDDTDTCAHCAELALLKEERDRLRAALEQIRDGKIYWQIRDGVNAEINGLEWHRKLAAEALKGSK